MVTTSKTILNCLLIAAIETKRSLPNGKEVAAQLRLSSDFPRHWLGRRGPFEWPLRSLDLIWPESISLFGVLWRTRYAQPVNSIEELKESIRNAFMLFDADLCSKICRSVVNRCTNHQVHRAEWWPLWKSLILCSVSSYAHMMSNLAKNRHVFKLDQGL